MSLSPDEMIESMDAAIAKEFEEYLRSIASAYAEPLGNAVAEREAEFHQRLNVVIESMEKQRIRLEGTTTQIGVTLQSEVERIESAVQHRFNTYLASIENEQLALESTLRKTSNDTHEYLKTFSDRLKTIQHWIIALFLFQCGLTIGLLYLLFWR